MTYLDPSYPKEWPAASICVQRMTSAQRHSGVVYRAELGGELRVLHLSGHHKLFDEPLEQFGNSLAVKTGLGPSRLEEVAIQCERIFDGVGSKISYAYSSHRSFFEPDAGVLLGPTNLGLTCASFVLAVFDSCHIDLLAFDTWPPTRFGDEEWRAGVIKWLARTGADPAHIAAVKAAPPGTRFRPEDVAAGGSLCPPPPAFDDVEELAHLLVKDLNG